MPRLFNYTQCIQLEWRTREFVFTELGHTRWALAGLVVVLVGSTPVAADSTQEEQRRMVVVDETPLVVQLACKPCQQGALLRSGGVSDPIARV